jgi:integrase
MAYPFEVVKTAPEFLKEAGYGKVSLIPCIFDARPGLHRSGSLYLQERALGIWLPQHVSKKKRRTIPALKSVENYAHRLINFLEWCFVNSLEPSNLDTNTDLVHGYRADMISGRWSLGGKPLSSRTVNVRMDTAYEYLEWLTYKGGRQVESTTNLLVCERINNQSDSSENTIARVANARVGKRHIVLPEESVLIAWRDRLKQRSLVGGTEVLIADLMMETAIRISEAAAWRVDTLPLDESDWHIPDTSVDDSMKVVVLDIKYGTKGPDYGWDHGDKIGPVGTIRIPYKLAIRIREYRRSVRQEALLMSVTSEKSLVEQRKKRDDSVHLFLNPKTGLRYTADKIYEFWRGATPPKGWTPHRCRDYWACTVLWTRLEQQRKLISKAIESDSLADLRRALLRTAETCIKIEIQPQLRHKYEDTTILYLQWLSDRIGININFHESWSEELL